MYPHDGQLGLGVGAIAIAGGLVTAVVMVFVGIFFTEKVFPIQSNP
jgi:hypothetical protein